MYNKNELISNVDVETPNEAWFGSGILEPLTPEDIERAQAIDNNYWKKEEEETDVDE